MMEAEHDTYDHELNPAAGEDDGFGLDGVEMALLSDNGVKLKVGPSVNHRKEGAWSLIKGILLETSPTLLFTIVGMVFSGELLQRISTSPAFLRVPELLILVPVLDNLKGNLEMNLSARLSTASNVGQLDERPARRTIILGSMALLQVQALSVSAVAAVVSFAVANVFPERETNAGRPKSGYNEFMMVTSSSMTAASLSSVILGSFMCSLILICRYLHLNPDNISSPVAACLGDLLTMALLTGVSTVLINFIRTVIPLILAGVLTATMTTAVIMTRRNAHVASLLFQGWSPLIGAMIISTGAGMVLEGFVSRYEGFAMLAIVIGGLPGSIGSIFICRLSTALHIADDSKGESSTMSPPEEQPLLVSAVLLVVSLPVAIAYLVFVWAAGWMMLPILFVVLFVVFLCITSAVSLLIGYWLTRLFWSLGLDPDLYCLPIQSSLIDLIGQALLVVCYEIARFGGASVGVS